MAIEQNALDVVQVLLEAGAESSGLEIKEIEKRTGKTIDDAIVEAVFDFCGK